MNIPVRPTVLLVHGFPGGSSDWARVAERLAPGTTVTPDLVGFGDRSGTAIFDDLSIEAQATSLADDLDAAGLADVVVAAHDFGVPVAVQLAHDRPDLVSGLVAMSGNVLADPPLAPPMRLVGRPMVGRPVERLLFSKRANRAMASFRTSGDARPRPNSPDELAAIRSIFATALADIGRHFRPIESMANALDIPTHVVWGRRDPFFPITFAERVATTLRAPLTALDGIGHYPHIEDPGAVADVIGRLTARVGAAD